MFACFFVCVCAFVCVLAHTFAEVRGQLAPDGFRRSHPGHWAWQLLYLLSHLTSLVYFKLFLYYWGSNPGPCELLGL